MTDLLFASRESAPEALRPLLTERDGKFVLVGGDAAEVPGFRKAAEFDEFRANNIALKQELEKQIAALKAYDGLDAAKAREALSRVKEFEQGDLKALPAGIRQMLESQKAVTDELKKQFDAEKTAREKAEENLAEKALEDSLRKELSPYVAEYAMADAMSRIRPLLVKGDDGKYRPVENGVPLLSAKNAGVPMGIDELAASKIRNNPDARHLLKPSAGAGIAGAAGPAASGQVRWNDLSGMAASLEDIASGKVEVVAQ